MKSITAKKNEVLHIETDLGIINIRTGLTDMKGRRVDSIEIIPDRYAGELKKRVIPGKYNTRIIELKTIKN
jgi:hypothetical protein